MSNDQILTHLYLTNTGRTYEMLLPLILITQKALQNIKNVKPVDETESNTIQELKRAVQDTIFHAAVLLNRESGFMTSEDYETLIQAEQ